ncbi:MAG TPA: SRPBCC family protein [Nocardioidaceae bacterium]|nr:SRPBCC family protein [Nocardioidaceae bacterium]
MTDTTTHETEIYADPTLPTIRVVREFDASPDRVFRAWTDPELVTQWMGPRDVTMQIEQWDARTGGSWRYRAVRDDLDVGFFGSFHEVRPHERLVQTFTFEGEPDGVSLDTMTFEARPGGRTRITGLSVVESMEIRDAIIASGMEVGVVEGYQKLDELLAEQS